MLRLQLVLQPLGFLFWKQCLCYIPKDGAFPKRGLLAEVKVPSGGSVSAVLRAWYSALWDIFAEHFWRLSWHSINSCIKSSWLCFQQVLFHCRGQHLWFSDSGGLEVPVHLCAHTSIGAHHTFTFCSYGIPLSLSRNFGIGWALQHILHHVELVWIFSGPGLTKPGEEVEHFKEALIRVISFTQKKKEKKRNNRNIRLIPGIKIGVFLFLDLFFISRSFL